MFIDREGKFVLLLLAAEFYLIKVLQFDVLAVRDEECLSRAKADFYKMTGAGGRPVDELFRLKKS